MPAPSSAPLSAEAPEIVQSHALFMLYGWAPQTFHMAVTRQGVLPRMEKQKPVSTTDIK